MQACLLFDVLARMLCAVRVCLLRAVLAHCAGILAVRCAGMLAGRCAGWAIWGQCSVVGSSISAVSAAVSL